MCSINKYFVFLTPSRTKKATNFFLYMCPMTYKTLDPSRLEPPIP